MDQKYFNAPITLYKGFLDNPDNCLSNVLLYHLYNHTLKLIEGSELEKMKSAANFYNVSLGNESYSFAKGEELYEDHNGEPMVGISRTMYWDFRSPGKTEQELVELLGYLALKSIIGNKAYCKLDNKYWLSRMAGKVKSTVLTSADSKIKKYASEYQTKKLKSAIREKYGLVTYSRYTRGFYVSFTLNLEQLILEAEKKRKSTKEKAYKRKERDIVADVLARLNP